MTITGQALAPPASVWPYPGVATVHALVSALGLDGQPIAQQAQAVRQFTETAAWEAAPPVLQRDVRRWLGLLYESQADLSITGQALGLADAGSITAQAAAIDLVGPHGYIHGWIYVGGPGLPSVAEHNAKLKAKGVTPPTKAHPALTREPPAVKAKAPAPKAAAPAPVKAAAVKSAPAAKAAPKPAPAPPAPTAGKAPAAPGHAPAVTPEAAQNAEKQAESISMLGKFGGKSTQLAVIKKRSTDDLKAADYGFQQRAAKTGHPDKVTGAHQMVRDELAKRGAALADLSAPARVKSADEIAKEQRKDLIAAWSTSYRYKGTTEAKDRRIADFAKEMHRLLSTNKQPDKCGSGCQDAHKFLGMVDKEARPQDKELQRGLTLSASAAERMFKPGKTMDMPVSSWTNDPKVASSYAGEEKPSGKVHVVLHAAPGAKGMDISAESIWHGTEKTSGENEVVSGGRFSVESVKTEGGVMHVYLTQKDFSAH